MCDKANEGMITRSETIPVRVAVVGSGPSGAYAADQLLRSSDHEIEVDLYERLPTPWGLVRAGVAPDHPKIKSVTRVYEKTAAHPRFTFFGNVELGRHISRDELLARYNAVIYAVGTPADRPMGIPGEELPGSWAATDFVGWYNAHPDQRDLEFDLSCKRAVVIGNGNVALDVARMLTMSCEALGATDIADHALEVLRHSSIEEVVVVGRRGPEQAAFTNPELLELGEMTGAAVDIDPADLEIAADLRETEPGVAAVKRMEILRDYAALQGAGNGKRIALRFLASPTRVLGDERVEGIELVRNELQRAEDGSLRARPTGELTTLDTGLVLRAIGYRGRPLGDIPFDERRGVIANVDGRVLGPDDSLTGEYVVGWAKRGPSGVIGTNKKCAAGTTAALLEDLSAGRLQDRDAASRDSVAAFLRARQRDLVEFADWQAIDEHEQDLGRPAGRPRVKLARVDEMVGVLGRDLRETG
jgi:ferredoxin--NADP+ reductase